MSRFLALVVRAALLFVSLSGQSVFAEAIPRSESMVRGIQQTLDPHDLADHFATLRRKILEHARARTNSEAQVSSDGASYVSIIPYVAGDANTRTNLGLNNFSQSSLTHGASPAANVAIGLFDAQGNLSGSGEFTVGSNHLLQLDNIISRLGSSIAAGWLLIYSDEPLTAWASVVRNDNNDPAIELAVADQINKPLAFVESTGSRLMIQSSAKGATFQSSLAVVNVGSGDGNLTVKIYNNVGVLLGTKTALLRADGLFVDNDIRSAFPGTFGQIVVEVTDANAADNRTPRLVANSFIRSTNGTSGFFPAFALPEPNTVSIAGKWEGTLTGGSLINAQARIELFQERDMLYGRMLILSGTFPTLKTSFLVSGDVVDNSYVLQIQDIFDSDSGNSLLAYRLFGALSNGRLQGDAIYFDERNRSSIGSFNLGRTGDIYE